MLTMQTYSAEFTNGTRATMTIGMTGIVIGWNPGPPRLRGKKLKNFLAAYREWRDTSLADYSQRTGKRIAVVEL